MRSLLLLPLLLLLAADSPESINQRVIEIANEYPDGGGYKWAGSGVPHEVKHKGTVLLPKSPEGTYCCGFTFAVAVRAGNAFGLFEDKTVAQMKQFQKDWYGVGAEVGAPLMSTALTHLGVGGAIAHDDAIAGDFLQFWRIKNKPSGHSVIFLEWIEQDEKRIGVRYRSSNELTDGIRTTVEYFHGQTVDGNKGTVDPNQMFFGRFEAE